MVGLGARAPLIMILMLAMAFAGCVGDEKVDPDANTPEDGTTTSTTGGTTAPTTDAGTTKKAPTKAGEEAPQDAAQAGCKFTFCIEGHVYAPVWDKDMTWTYAVEGAYYGREAYEATFGVFKVNDDHFLMGTDSEEELKNGASTFGVMTGQVQKDSYGILEHDAYQDVLGFLKIDDTTWKIRMWDVEFTVNKEKSTTIEHATASSLGIRVRGASADGDSLLVEYASDAAWITKLEWTNSEGVVQMSYTLTDFNAKGSAAGFRIWDRVDWQVGRATGQTSPAGFTTWNPDGEADKMFIRIKSERGATGRVDLVVPGATPTAESQDVASGEVYDLIKPYVSGDWRWLITTPRDEGGTPMGGGNVAAFFTSVTERAG